MHTGAKHPKLSKRLVVGNLVILRQQTNVETVLEEGSN